MSLGAVGESDEADVFLINTSGEEEVVGGLHGGASGPDIVEEEVGG